jgi:sugar-specific transcriptional regulator TrmB
MTSDANDLSGSLEEFGLSKYEARAYLTMIGRGSLAASEIAYYSNLPRTKIYQTLKKLEKKRLAIVSRQKPLICSAIPPEEAFNEIVSLYDRRLKNMRRIVDELQKASDGAQHPKGSEERRYSALDADSALAKISELIAHSRSSVAAALDGWGVRLISQCKSSLVRAITNGVQARLLVASECIEGEHFFSLPEGIELRSGLFAFNLIVIDSVKIMTIESSNGKAALFTSTDPFGSVQLRHFERAWSDAREVHFLLDTQPSIAATALQMAKVVENGLSARMLDYAFSGRDVTVELIDVIEGKYGLAISSMKTEELLSAIDSALKLTCLGGLKHDRNSNTLSIHSRFEGKNLIPWALLVSCYFKRQGNEAKIMQHGENAQVIHLKLARSAI